jgi:hypothetical protein
MVPHWLERKFWGVSAVPTGLLCLLCRTQDFILGYFQPSLTGLLVWRHPTQDFILGYFQPSLRDYSCGDTVVDPKTETRDCGENGDRYRPK